MVLVGDVGILSYIGAYFEHRGDSSRWDFSYFTRDLPEDCSENIALPRNAFVTTMRQLSSTGLIKVEEVRTFLLKKLESKLKNEILEKFEVDGRKIPNFDEAHILRSSRTF